MKIRMRIVFTVWEILDPFYRARILETMAMSLLESQMAAEESSSENCSAIMEAILNRNFQKCEEEI